MKNRLALDSSCFIAHSRSHGGGRDWIHWRGPEQNGLSPREEPARRLRPDRRDEGEPGLEAALRRPLDAARHGGPALHHPGRRRRHQRGRTGRLLRREDRQEAVGVPGQRLPHRHRLQSRLGWTTLTADPATGYVYAHATGGDLLCLDKDGKLRLVAAADRGVRPRHRLRRPHRHARSSTAASSSSACVNSAAGAIRPAGSNRFVAFDGKTGEVVWWSTPNRHDPERHVLLEPGHRRHQRPAAAHLRRGRRRPARPQGPHRRAGLELPLQQGRRSTARRSWTATSSTAPTARRTPKAAPIGRVICVDASQVDPETKKPKLVWDTFRRPIRPIGHPLQPIRARFGSLRRRPALLPGRLRRTVLLPRKGWRTALEVPLRDGGPRRAAHRRRQALHLRREGQDRHHPAQRRQRPDPTMCLRTGSAAGRGLERDQRHAHRRERPRLLHHAHRPLLRRRAERQGRVKSKYKPLPAETPFKAERHRGRSSLPGRRDREGRARRLTFKVVYVDANGREVQDNRPCPRRRVELLPLPPQDAQPGAQPAGAARQDRGRRADARRALPTQHGYVEFRRSAS